MHDLKCFSGSFSKLKLCHLIIAFFSLFLMDPRPFLRVMVFSGKRSSLHSSSASLPPDITSSHCATSLLVCRFYV